MHTTSCLACRGRKIKCQRESETEVCARCRKKGIPCDTKPRILGRKRGHRNRKTLERLAAEAGTSERAADYRKEAALLGASSKASLSPKSETLSIEESPELHHPNSINPLHILADTSIAHKGQEQLAPVELHDLPQPLRIQDGLQALFSPEQHSRETASRAVENVELSKTDGLASHPEYDVVNVGIVSEEQASLLFDYFMDNLAPLLHMFDPALHTFAFVRLRSTFLFSTILKNAAKYYPGFSHTTLQRLSEHTQGLQMQTYMDNARSIEIVQGLMVDALWLGQAEEGDLQWQERCWQHIATAIMQATTLRLDRLIPFCVSSNMQYQKASAEMQVKLVRNSQRTWLNLYTFDRALALVRGREPLVAEGELSSKRMLATWHTAPGSIDHDVLTTSSASSRQMLIQVQRQVAAQVASDETVRFEDVKMIVDEGFGRWTAQWKSLMTAKHYAIHDIILKASRFLVLMVPFERMLNQGRLNESTLGLCLQESTSACQSIDTWVSRQGGSGIQEARYLCPSITLTMLTYAAVLTVKLMGSKLELTRESHLEDLFRLSTLTQLAIQLQNFGSIPLGKSPAISLGKYLFATLRQIGMVMIRSIRLPLHPSQAQAQSHNRSHSSHPSVSSTITQQSPQYQQPAMVPPIPAPIPRLDSAYNTPNIPSRSHSQSHSHSHHRRLSNSHAPPTNLVNAYPQPSYPAPLPHSTSASTSASAPTAALTKDEYDKYSASSVAFAQLMSSLEHHNPASFHMGYAPPPPPSQSQSQSSQTAGPGPGGDNGIRGVGHGVVNGGLDEQVRGISNGSLGLGGQVNEHGYEAVLGNGDGGAGGGGLLSEQYGYEGMDLSAFGLLLNESTGMNGWMMDYGMPMAGRGY
ncbi:hypothetical protein L198_07821 [Cryptococcus wingfieldii CBS 7118]|uniref:Zn(2)-C6 fungal-type domain-containing protein n=1 Tax=Cryptococcus wingfieldii CBS 7118 TaxID=1295528 RepID=A0A1E3HXL4_9TREE|nr:hypothetical protein L198_07821 [Cryptococcus wingfieldii CBS 7118]ODN80321.1 hypothetical protein L198_07821 [Cryptococcus wingfieldii CBS 7118]